MPIAFFDLDKTLLAVNSGTLWVRREVALGHITKRQALRAALWLARYQLGFATGETMVADAVAELKGTRADEIQDRTRVFYESQVRTSYRPGGLAALAAHQRAHDRCVLLTSASHYLAELVVADLGLDGMLCNRIESDESGRHTGRIIGRPCFGTGKLHHALIEAEHAKASLADCTFYTDSFSDLSVLEVVGSPVVVNPDPRLKRHAKQRGWKQLDWGDAHHEPLRRAS